MNSLNTPNCSQCGSPLILVSQITEKIEGSLHPQTNTIYRCSNQSCQDEKDRQTEKRIKLQQDKERADKKRIEAKQMTKATPKL